MYYIKETELEEIITNLWEWLYPIAEVKIKEIREFEKFIKDRVHVVQSEHCICIADHYGSAGYEPNCLLHGGL